jgi:CRP-like cAMP-binding protein
LSDVQFTVDCFGDVWARNFLETLFAMFTCALGWIFIGQVIGRINALMITLDKDRKQRNDRIEHFQQYAKQRRLPEALRLRALEGLDFKSECSVALRLRDTLRDLPAALRAGLFYELYGPVLHSVPELHGTLAPVHLEALSNALYLEIYLHGDVIYEAGRRGNRLYLLQDGLIEVYGALSGTVFARIEAGSSRTATVGGASGEVGALFGEFAFFIRGARRLTSVRAVRSCQVLQLERSVWAGLWPRDVRTSVERALLPRVQRKFRDTARAFLNIDKNLFVRSDAPLPALTANGLEVAAVLAQERNAVQTWGRQQHPRPRLSFERALLRPPRTSFTNPRPARRRSSVASVSSTESTFDVEQVGGPTSASGAATRLMQVASMSSQAQPSSSQSRRLSSLGMLRTNSLSTPVETLTHGTATPQEAPNKPAPVVKMGSVRRLLPSVLSGSGRRLSNSVESDSKAAADSLPKNGKTTPISMMVASRRSFAVSSVLIEIQWKRHEKRLRALQLFAFSWAEIEKNTLSNEPQRMQRRRSITIARGLSSVLRRPAVAGGPRSVDDGQIRMSSTLPVSSEVIEAARRGPRRHSLLVVRQDLDRKLALAEEAVPMLAARITAHLKLEARASSSVRRKSTIGGASSSRVASSRRASSVNMEEEGLYTDAADFDDSDSVGESAYQEDSPTGNWLGDLFRRPLRSMVSGSVAMSAAVASSKVVPAPMTAAPPRTAASPADAVRSSIVLATASLPPLLGQLTGAPAAHSGQFGINSKFRRLWSAVMLAVTVYHISITPFRVSFMDGFLNDLTIEPLVAIWFALELVVVDLAFAVDFVLQLRYFAFVDRGETISDPQSITAHYRQDGSFLIDLLSILPLELLLVAVAPFLGDAPARSSPDEWPLFHSPSGGFINWHTIAFFKLNRFLRVVHVHSLSDQIQRALLYEFKSLSKLQLRPGVLYLARLALDFHLGTHWLACIFFGVSYLNFQDGDVSWLTTPGMLTVEGCSGLREIRRVPVSAAYLRSFHFSIGAITTVCYGDILPMNAVENAATLAVIFVSVLLFSMLSGGFFKFFAMELGTRAEFEERVAQVGHYMTFHDFPANMWTQMKVYFALSWQESKGMHEEQQLRGLPTTLRQDIARHVHANLIQNVRLFHSCEEPFSKAIIAAIKHEFFVRNDVIIQRGDMERSLYIVETGLVVISAVRKKKPKAAATAGTRVNSITAPDTDAEGDGERHGDRQKRSGVESSEARDHENDSVNEWLTLSRQQSRLAGVNQKPPGGNKVDLAGNEKPQRREASVAGVISPAGEGSGPPDINALTEREERIVKGPFEYFGERSLLFGTPRNATCVAACVSSLFVLTSDRFDAILEEFPSYRSKVVRAWVMTRHSPASEVAPTPVKTASMR